MKKPIALLLSLAVMPASYAADLWEVYQMAAERDSQLRAAAAARNAAIEAKPQARAGLLPNINLTGTLERERSDPKSGSTSYATNENYGIGLNQALFRYDRFVQLQQADNQVAQAEAEYSAEEQLLILRVTERYFDVLGAMDNLTFAEAENKAISRQLEQAQQRFEVGLIAITDVHEAQARFDLSTSAVITAKNQLASAQEALREVAGEYNLPLLPPVDLSLQQPEPSDADAWVDQALTGNLTLMATASSVEAARDEVRRQKAGHLPTLDLNADYSYTDSTINGITPIENEGASVGLQLNIPLYQGGLTSSQSRAAQYRFVQSKEQLEGLKRSTERSTRDAYRGVVSGIAQVKALEQALVSTETALQAAETGFEVGTRTIVDVLDAQQARYAAERDLKRSRYDYLLNTLRLKQAAGSLEPADIEAMNRWFGAS